MVKNVFTNSRGVTLLELIIAVGIVGVIAAMAVPAFDNQLKDSRLVSNANLVIGAYNLARSEAINRGVQTQVVSASLGWAVEEVVSGEQIKLFEPDQSGINWSGYAPVIYNPSGFRPFGSVVVAIKLCDSRNKGREITISTVGSTSINKSPAC